MDRMEIAEDAERLKKAKMLLALSDPKRAAETQDAVDNAMKARLGDREAMREKAQREREARREAMKAQRGQIP